MHVAIMNFNTIERVLEGYRGWSCAAIERITLGIFLTRSDAPSIWDVITIIYDMESGRLLSVMYADSLSGAELLTSGKSDNMAEKSIRA